MSYVYDKTNGLRLSKTVGDTTYEYYYGDSQLLRMTVSDGTVMDFFYDHNGLPYAVKYNGTNYYYVLNQQGDVVRLVSADGTTVGTYQYDAWGNILSATDNDLTNANPLRYRGYVYDDETGLYYVSSRYYDPEIGRFVNADSAYDTNQGILGYNMYTYCLNNPTNMYDPDGTCSRFLGFLWKIDCKRASCSDSKNYVKPKAVDPIGSYNNGQGYVYIVKKNLLDEIMEDKEDNVVVILDNRTASDPNMQIQSSYRITKTKQQKEIAQLMLDYNTSNPVEPAWSRTLGSLVEEWELHNFAYSWKIKRERTADCDFNNADEGAGFWDFVRR